MKEKRQQQRVLQTPGTVHIQSKYFQWYRSNVINISELGLAVKSPATMPAGHRVNMYITLPETGEKYRICCAATVMHCHKHADQYIIGLRFDTLDGTDREIIRAHIAQPALTPTRIAAA